VVGWSFVASRIFSYVPRATHPYRWVSRRSMSNLIKSFVFLFFCFIPTVCFSAPENSHILGDNWYCNDGYKKIGNRCIKLQVPENAHVLGNNWYCDDGYKKQGYQCIKLEVPINAHVLGNNWYCNDGYKKQGNRCISLRVPKNAHVTGNNWYCNQGYKKQNGKCIKMSPAELATLRKKQEEQKTSMTDGTVAYQTKIDSDSGDIIKLENGAIVEVSSYFGYLGYRKSAVLYGSGHRCNIWIAGKKSYKCELLKAPEGRGEPAKEVHISEVKGNGAILIMLDGSIYEVDSIDEIYTSLWLGISDGILISGTTLINFDSDEAVTVYRIK